MDCLDSGGGGHSRLSRLDTPTRGGGGDTPTRGGTPTAAASANASRRNSESVIHGAVAIAAAVPQLMGAGRLRRGGDTPTSAANTPPPELRLPRAAAVAAAAASSRYTIRCGT